MNELRPTRLADFGGQRTLVHRLGMILAAAKSRGELADHILLVGPPGLGKTTLAHIVAAELGAGITVTSGPALERPGDVASLLSGLVEPTVVFVDEIHRLDRAVEELLYPAMEDGVVDFRVGEGYSARAVRLPLAPLCLIGATTQAGLVSAPLRDRFGFVARLEPYALDDLAAIVARTAGLLGVDLDAAAARVIAARARRTPRVANMLVRRVRDFADAEGRARIDAEGAVAAMEAFGVDDLGLEALDRRLLCALAEHFGGGPAGIGALAAAVGETVATIEEVHEPWLLACGLVARTQRGRVLTAEGWDRYRALHAS